MTSTISLKIIQTSRTIFKRHSVFSYRIHFDNGALWSEMHEVLKLNDTDAAETGTFLDAKMYTTAGAVTVNRSDQTSIDGPLGNDCTMDSAVGSVSDEFVTMYTWNNLKKMCTESRYNCLCKQLLLFSCFRVCSSLQNYLLLQTLRCSAWRRQTVGLIE
jgi:hypothetical protein